MNAPMREDHLRQPPASVESEQSVLGAVLYDCAACYDRVSEVLEERDFFVARHRLIWRAIAKQVDRGLMADTITVFEALKASSDLDEAGGLEYLAALTANVVGTANVSAYARTVRDKALLRGVVTTSTEITEEALAPGASAEQVIGQAESRIYNLGTSRRQGGDFVLARSIVADVVERIDIRHSNPQDVTGLPSGFSELDHITAGLQPSDLIIIAARPSMGKTALAMNMVEHCVLVEEQPAAVFSMEMSSGQLVQRMIGSVARVNQHALRTGRIHDDDWPRLTDAWGRINQAQLYLDDSPALTPSTIASRARRLHRQVGGPGLGLIVIDYLQLMSVTGHGENRATEISEISRSLKALAKELSVPVIALSQLNRSLESRPNKRPIMSDLRESGAIEQDADLILFIYREEVYNADSPDKGTAEVIIGKHRNGPIGAVRLAFQAQYTRFDNLAHGWQPQLPVVSAGDSTRVKGFRPRAAS